MGNYHSNGTSSFYPLRIMRSRCVMGYARKGSMPSLVAGTTFSIIYGVAGYLLKQNADYGLELALGASTTLLAAGIGRAIPSRFKKPVPLVLLVLGGVSS